jgi:transposase-like protein
MDIEREIAVFAAGDHSEDDPGASLELPPPNPKRWTARRKATVVEAVHTGVLTLAEACERYNLSAEEVAAWQEAIERHGIYGLRATRVQIYRGRERKR